MAGTFLDFPVAISSFMYNFLGDLWLVNLQKSFLLYLSLEFESYSKDECVCEGYSS